MIARVLALFPMLALGGCMGAGSAAPPPSAVSDYERAQEQRVGERRWVNAKHPLQLCDRVHTPHSGVPRCNIVRSGQFTVERVEKTRGLPSFYIRLADGRGGYVDTTGMIMSDDEAARKQHVAAVAECDRRGGVAVGMTRAQVYASCWGKPQRINTTTTAGRQSEQLVYGGGYVYLTNGVVTAVQTTNR